MEANRSFLLNPLAHDFRLLTKKPRVTFSSMCSFNEGKIETILIGPHEFHISLLLHFPAFLSGVSNSKLRLHLLLPIPSQSQCYSRLDAH